MLAWLGPAILAQLFWPVLAWLPASGQSRNITNSTGTAIATATPAGDDTIQENMLGIIQALPVHPTVKDTKKKGDIFRFQPNNCMEWSVLLGTSLFLLTLIH